MAQDDINKEDKFDFTSEGEALGYISPEQAVVLAMRTARETPGPYGPAYQDVPMVFDVVEDNDGEDHYLITLSFRPQGQFDGTPGVEQFFIEKTGSLAHRQVRSLPMVAEARRFPVILVAAGLALVVIIAVLVLVFVMIYPEGGGNDETRIAPKSSTGTRTKVPRDAAMTLEERQIPGATPSLRQNNTRPPSVKEVISGVLADTADEWVGSVREVNFTAGDLVNRIRVLQGLRGQVDLSTVPFEYLRNLINAEILRQSAPNLGISLTDEDVDRALRDQFYPAVPEAQGSSPSQLEEEFRNNYRIFLARTNVTDDEFRGIVKERLALNELTSLLGQSIPDTMEQVEVEWIRVDIDGRVDVAEVRQRLEKEGVNEFGNLAEEFGASVGFADQRGYVGWVPKLAFPDLDAALFGDQDKGTAPLRAGEISRPLFTVDGVYIVYMLTGPSDRKLSDLMRSKLNIELVSKWENNQQLRGADEGWLRMNFNSEIYAWVADQVRVGSPPKKSEPPKQGGGRITDLLRNAPIGGSSSEYVDGLGVRQELMPTGPRGLNAHVSNDQTVEYSTSPPTSGDHWDRPANCGFYEDGLPDEQIVHNLEHGNIVISYNLSSEAEVDQLRDALDGVGLSEIWGVARSYDKIPSGTVALAAWGVLDTMQVVDADRIQEFFEAYSGALGPESIICPGAGVQHSR